MNDSVNTGSTKTLGYVLVLLGIVLIALSYYFVFTKTNDKIDTIEDEISSLKTRRDQLRKLENDKETMLKNKEKANKEYEELIKGYDGDITYRSEIMDAYEMTQKFDIKIENVGLTPFSDVYTFGAIPSSNPSGGTGGANPTYVGKMEAYNLTAQCNYDVTKEVLKYLTDGGCPYREDGKRKVIKSVMFGPDKTTQIVKIDLVMAEYAITGEDREMTEVPEYDFPISTPNIFWGNEIVAQ